MSEVERLVAFVRACLDADEAAARAATPGPWTLWDRGVGWEINELPEVHDGTTFRKPDAEHIARHDPTRVLADVAAKRRLVSLHSMDERRGSCFDCETPLCLIHLALAQPYAGLPGWDDAWKVET